MFTNYIPTKLYFGAGELEKLGSIPLPGKKALIVITCGKSIRANCFKCRSFKCKFYVVEFKKKLILLDYRVFRLCQYSYYIIFIQSV